jgi:hypothetical protein
MAVAGVSSVVGGAAVAVEPEISWLKLPSIQPIWEKEPVRYWSSRLGSETRTARPASSGNRAL